MNRRWHWATAGAALGAVSTAVTALGGRLGTSSAYTRTVGKATEFFSPSLANETFMAQPAGCGGGVPILTGLEVGWPVMLIIGLFLGGLLASRLRGRSDTTAGADNNSNSGGSEGDLPVMWRNRFGNRPWLRVAHGFLGGFIMLVATRIAGGCTSGLVISGMGRLELSGLVFGIAVFAAGIPTALLLYRGKGVSS